MKPIRNSVLQFLAGSRSHPSKPKLRAPASQNQNGATKGKAKADHTSALRNGAQVEQVGEHLSHVSTVLVFDYECYPEAKVLLGCELKALFLKLGSWTAVGSSIGASESFARQNVNKE